MDDSVDSKYIYIVDTTLRDGEQAPGLVFSNEQKRNIAELLCQVGIDEIEAGIPAMGTKEQEFIKSLNDLPASICCWCRGNVSDIYSAAKCNTGHIHISLPVSDIILNTMDKDINWVFSNLEYLYNEAKKYFDYISIGAMDASRTNISLLKEFVKAADEIGYFRIRITDTVGILDPVGVFNLINSINTEGSNIEFHGHNDLGMATANTVTAIKAGASSVSATVNGIGERAGNAALEEVLSAIKLSKLFYHPGSFEVLQKLSKYVESAYKEPLPSNKPIVGKNIFTHESGIHCSGLLKDPLSFQPFNPSLVGRSKVSIIIGKHSGTAAIRHVMLKNGLEISKDKAAMLLPLIKEKSGQLMRALYESEIIDLYYKVLVNQRSSA